MSISNETQVKISKFAKEQAQHYLDAAEMTYIEKLRRKTGQTKEKIGRKLSKFKGSSEQSREAQNDMILYMSDYMNDLMSKGMSEQEAFEKAKKELSDTGDSDLHTDLHERFQQYYKNLSPADYEVIGLFYAGFTVIGMVIGALAGYVISGGRQEFLYGGWIDTIVGTFVGLLIGTGLALICNAIVGIKKR